jgi:hypothetical protein
MRIFHVLDDNVAENSVEGKLEWYNARYYSQEKYEQHTTRLRGGQTTTSLQSHLMEKVA